MLLARVFLLTIVARCVSQANHNSFNAQSFHRFPITPSFNFNSYCFGNMHPLVIKLASIPTNLILQTLSPAFKIVFIHFLTVTHISLLTLSFPYSNSIYNFYLSSQFQRQYVVAVSHSLSLHNLFLLGSSAAAGIF